MNNYRLSTYSGNSNKLSNEEINKLINTTPLIEYLWNGRKRNIYSKKIINQHESNIYEIVKPSNEVLTVQTLTQAAKIVSVNIKTLSKYLDKKSPNNLEYTALVKKHKIKRIKIFLK